MVPEAAWTDAAFGTGGRGGGRLNGILAEGIFPTLELLGSSLHCCKNLIGDNAAPSDSVLD